MTFVRYRNSLKDKTIDQLNAEYYALNQTIRQTIDSSPPGQRGLGKYGDNTKDIRDLKRKRAIVLTVLNQKGVNKP